jgi:hypothetical protein
MTARFLYSSARTPPIPAVTFALLTPDGLRSVPGVEGHFDTAADATVIPLRLVGHLGLLPAWQVTAHGFAGGTYRLDVYRVRLDLPGLAPLLVGAIAHGDEKYVLIGRDILNQFRVTFDGPAGATEFH